MTKTWCGVRDIAVMLAAVAATLAARLLSDPALGEFAPFIFFIAAVAISAWRGGWRMGAIATLLGVGLGNYFFTEPAFSFQIHDATEAVQQAAFILVGLLISGLSEARLRSVYAAQAHVRRLQELTSELTLAEQRARRSIAQGLHDDLQQLLVATRFHCDSWRRSTSTGNIGETVDGLLREAIEYTRTLTAQLCPPPLQEGDWVGAIRWLGEHFGKRHGLHLRVDAPSVPVDVLDPDEQILMFQCVRELLFNIVKHAGVDNADVRIEHDAKEVRVTVADRGAGYDPAIVRDTKRSGFGLTSVFERFELVGGRVVVRSRPGDGTETTLILPSRPALPPAIAAPATPPRPDPLSPTPTAGPG